MNKKIRIIILSLILLSAYSYRVYSINKNSPDLRNYTEEKIGQEFKAFGGEILVKNIEVIDKNKLREKNKKYINENHSNYIKVVYKTKDIDNKTLEIMLNTDGYTFDNGLPYLDKIGTDEYEYIIPVYNYRNIKQKGVKIFFDSVKSNELEHHYITLEEGNDE